MKKSTLPKIIAVVLCVFMIISVMPLSVMAAEYDTSVSGDYYTILSKKDYVLCDGATESDIVLNNENGSRRQVLHIMEIDPNNTNVEVLPSYYQIDKDLTDSSNWTAQIMEKQMDYYRDELGYNVVGGMNTALAYDNEAPYGVMVYNGKVLADGKTHAGAQTYLAVIKNDDGTVSFDLRSVSDGLKGDEWQAVSTNFGFVVRDGKLVTSTVNRNDYADRSMVGIKADGTLVICQAEGRNAPYAVGLSSYELGETMLALGCVWAVNGDGGGSSQFLTKREGEADFTLRNIPSDGTPRATINGIIIASKAAPSGVFDHVSMIAENQYITPGSSVSVKIKGVDAAGSSAELPESGLTYETNGGSFENGIYTADNTTGTKTITAFYNGEAVGSVNVEVVIPTSIEFNSAEMVVPYGKSVDLGLNAYYGAFEVPLKTDDVTLSLSNKNVGTISGFTFTSTADTDLTDTTSSITATLTYNNEVTASATISLGKGSEIVYDFEDQDIHGFYRSTSANYNYNCPGGSTYLVDKTSGKVRNGDYAMGVEVDFSNSLEAGYQLGTLNSGETKVFEGAKTIGMWIYLPDEASGLRIDPKIYSVDETGKTLSTSGGNATISNTGETDKTEVGFVYGMEESGWRYITIDVSTFTRSALITDNQFLQFYVCQKDGKNGYSYGDQSSVNGKYVFYIDDITVDYSSAVDDRETPIFSNVSYATRGMDESVVLLKDTSATYAPVTITDNIVSFVASVTDDTTKSNYTGIDTTTGKVYIDGVDYTSELVWTGTSKMSLNDIKLSNGRHVIKFEVCDKQGNYSSVIRDIIINSIDDAAVKVVAHDPDADRILLGSTYYIDVVADDISNVQSVDVTLDLNNISVWELENMDVAYGFEADYTLIEDENIANITINRVTKNYQETDNVLVSIPTRTWQLAPTVAIYGHKDKIWMYPDYKKGNEILPMDLSVEVDAGTVTYIDGTSDSFASPTIQVDTEMSGNAYTSSGSAANNYIRNESWYAGWNAGHDHRVDTAQYYAEGATNVVTPVALEDKQPTCTENGYTGRTYCETCKSVVDWGTTIPATGHDYKLSDGKFACDCGDFINETGIVEMNGKTYYMITGKLITGWISNGSDYYYFDTKTYEALKDGRFNIDGFWYSFDENGIHTEGQWVNLFYNGKYETRYKFAGKYISEHFHEIDGKTYWFGENGLLAKGTQILQTADGVDNKYVYVIDENGVVDGILDYTGVYDVNGTLYYVVNGKVTGGGVIDIDGDLYYVEWNGVVGTGKVYVVAERTNGLVNVGWNYFGEDGKLIKNDLCTVDGTTYYVVNGQPAKGYGVIEVEDKLYYINSAGAVGTGKLYVTSGETNDLVNTGYIYTDSTGRIYDNEFAEIDGKILYVVKGQPVKSSASAVKEINGELYFVEWNGNIPTGKIYVTDAECNGLTTAGWHYTDETGKFYNNEVVEVEDTNYYMINGKPFATGESKVQELNGELYFVEWNGSVATGKQYIGAEYVNGLTTAGWHYTDETGRLYNNELAIIDGSVYYMVHGQMDRTGVSKVREINGELYFVEWNGHVPTGKQYIGAEYVNGLTTAGWHYTDETGRLYNNEFATIDGKIYYMVHGQMDRTGVSKVREINDELYFVEWNGHVPTGKQYIGAEYVNGLTTAGWHYTDETGRLYDNELATIDDSVYYMVHGQMDRTGASEVREINDTLYYVEWNGHVATGKIYVSANETNDYVTAGWVYADETGALYNDEFVEISGTLYFMENGTPVKNGVFEYNGGLYYAMWNGTIARNGKFYIMDEECNDLIIFGNHTFDANGKMIA